MGVTTGELQAGDSQIITITIPNALTNAVATMLADEIQQIIDAFNATHRPDSVEVL